MAKDLISAYKAALREIKDVPHPDARQHGDALRDYMTARIAVAILPGREASIAYVLGIRAGWRFAESLALPGAPFAADTREAQDYAQGVKDAMIVELITLKAHAGAKGGA